MMTKFSLLLFLCSSLMATCQTKKDDILGKWMATDRSVSVNVYKENNAYRAKILWYDQSLGSGKPIHASTDAHNPNPNLRHRKVIGMEILNSLVYNAETQRWEKGKIYDASSGRTWDANVEMKGEDHLCVRGFWKWTWIGKSLCFNRM